MLDLFAAIQQDIHDDIWNTHARNLHDFEKSVLNINKKDKKSYRSTFRSPKKKRTAFTHKHPHGVAFPLNRNSYDVPNLASSSRQTHPDSTKMPLSDIPVVTFCTRVHGNGTVLVAMFLI
ncbi:hypothetical protein RclHR1_13990004 [Rhizophagus clarus]|uniref:Uncharacterized protein n=1 Tax=Rhizophagus clarus TaxID=94130 RepID=A0A2Z6QR55_9GLOM|nr:hypothetical protein RclHR1_13990004 [Rhizophagus clarus]GET04131.1 hypothetical protein RCL_jg24457.t1 [Rhizophagus clarus]